MNSSHVAAVNTNGTKTLLGSGLSTFFIKGNPAHGSGPKSIPKNTSDCHISCNWVFDNYILAKELFAKASKLVYYLIAVYAKNYSHH